MDKPTDRSIMDAWTDSLTNPQWHTWLRTKGDKGHDWAGWRIFKQISTHIILSDIKQSRKHGRFSCMLLGRGSNNTVYTTSGTRRVVTLSIAQIVLLREFGSFSLPATDRPTDRPTDRVAYRVACTRLKNRNMWYILLRGSFLSLSVFLIW